MTEVEILSFDGCPNAAAAEALVRDALAHSGIEVEVRRTRLETTEEAERALFLGSPTVRVDGRDVEPGAEDRRDYALACRVYPGGRGLPDRAWLAAALAEAAARRT